MNVLINKFYQVGSCVAMIALATAVGCSSAKKVTEEEGEIRAAVGATENPQGDSDSGDAMGLQTINFPYDSYNLTSDAMDNLNSNVSILKENPNVKIEVEGHCDSRGGIQYNIALGEKRANAVRRWLINRGISGDRISTVSFGKEKLLDPGSSEAAHARNRRANFVIRGN